MAFLQNIFRRLVRGLLPGNSIEKILKVQICESGAMKNAIRIPYTAHIQDNRTFLPPEEYRRLPLEKIPKHWTIQEGDYIFPKLMYPKRWRWDDFSFRTGMIVPEWNDIEAGIYYGKKWRWDPFSFRYGRITASSISDVGVYLNKKYGKMIKVTGYADNTKRGSPRVRHWKVGAA